MRKVVLTLAAIAVVAAPSAALAKRHHHRHHHHPAPIAAVPDPFNPGWNFFWTGVDAVLITPFRSVFVVTEPAPVVAKY